MPVKPEDQDLYGKIVGKNINSGKDLDDAKDIADRAIKKVKRQKGHRNPKDHPWRKS